MRVPAFCLGELLADPSQGETGERDSQLRRGKVGVEVSAHVPDEGRTLVSFIDQLIELAAPDFDDGEFARDEKAVQADEKRDRGQLKGDDRGWIPVDSSQVRDGWAMRGCLLAECLGKASVTANQKSYQLDLTTPWDEPRRSEFMEGQA